MTKSKKSKKDEVFKVDLPNKKVGFSEFLKLVAIPDQKQTSKKSTTSFRGYS